MTRTRVQFRKAGQGFEALKQGLRHRRETRAAADTIKAGKQAIAGIFDGRPVPVVDHPGAVQVIEVSQELLAVEIGEGSPHFGIQGVLLGDHVTSRVGCDLDKSSQGGESLSTRRNGTEAISAQPSATTGAFGSRGAENSQRATARAGIEVPLRAPTLGARAER